MAANDIYIDHGSNGDSGTEAVAAIDRIVHHSTIINITGESYRKKNSQDKNVFENGGENVIRN